MKKRVLSLILLTLMLVTFIPAVSAADDITVLLNGQPVVFADQKPIIVNDRTLVPFRAIFEALGCSVEWDGDNYAVYGTYREGDYQRVISLFIGKPVVMYTDQVVAGEAAAEITTSGTILDVSPEIYNDRTLVPLRAVSEILGAKVDWDNDTRTVIIETGDTFAQYKDVPSTDIETYISSSLLGTEEFVVTEDKELTPAQTDAYLKEVLDKAKANFESAASFYDEGAGIASRVFAKGSVDSDLEQLVLSLGNGEVGVVRLTDGYHIVKKVDLKSADVAARAAALKYFIQ